MSRRVALPVGEYPETPLPRVRLIRDIDRLQALLEAHRAYAATVFGYLEPRRFPHTLWHALDGEEDRALFLQSHGPGGATLFCQGDPAGLEAILRQVSLQKYSYITFEARHHELARRHFILRGVQRLMRMVVDASVFQPVPLRAVPLEAGHLSQINSLYRNAGGVLLSGQHFAEESYYGIWEGPKLVSVAGTQLISERYGVAVVANVLTHPQYRNRGLATQCVSALTVALLDRVGIVALNVDPENAPAVRAYQRLGYQEACRLAEAWAIWRGRTLLDKIVAALYDWFVL